MTKLAEGIGATSAAPVDVVAAYAEGFTERYRHANLESCLDALTGQPMEWP